MLPVHLEFWSIDEEDRQECLSYNDMTHTTILTRAEVETMGPPVPEELADLGVGEAFLCDLALKHVAMIPEPTTAAIAERLCLPRATHRRNSAKALSREADRSAPSIRGRFDSLRDVGPWLGSSRSVVVGLWLRWRGAGFAARLQPHDASAVDPVAPGLDGNCPPGISRSDSAGVAVADAGLRDQFAASLFLTDLPGTGKTAVAERINNALPGAIWIPYAVEIDGQIIRVFDSHCHRPASMDVTPVEYDRRWVLIHRPLVVVGGELTLENADLTWSEAAKFYEAPFQMKSNGGTLVIDDFGRQRVAPQDLLNRWIVPLERRVDYLALHTGKKIEVPFEQLVVFSTNLDENDLADQAFLRRMGYRARVEPPTPRAYTEIFKRQAHTRGIRFQAAGNGPCAQQVQSLWTPDERVRAARPAGPRDRYLSLCRRCPGAFAWSD